MDPAPSLVMAVPGDSGSGPGHRQSPWERAHPEYRRVEQRGRDRPEREEWIRALEREIRRAEGRVVLVAHSAGCAAVAQWAARHGAGPVAGALLVAPGDVEAADAPEGERLLDTLLGRSR